MTEAHSLEWGQVRAVGSKVADGVGDPRCQELHHRQQTGGPGEPLTTGQQRSPRNKEEKNKTITYNDCGGYVETPWPVNGSFRGCMVRGGRWQTVEARTGRHPHRSAAEHPDVPGYTHSSPANPQQDHSYVPHEPWPQIGRKCGEASLPRALGAARHEFGGGRACA